MATLAELRTLVRTQTETTSSELPDATINWYLRQAFDRTIAVENTWPSYEERWVTTLPAGESSFAIPADCNRASISSLVSSNDNFRLSMTDHETAEDYYGAGNFVGATSPFEFSLWSGQIYLWPKPNYTVDRTYTLRGYRYPTDWIAVGANSEVDADSRLHYPLAHYAIALAYAQQEDETLEDVYMRRWQMDVEAARSAIMEPSRQKPMQFGGGRRAFSRRLRFNIVTP